MSYVRVTIWVLCLAVMLHVPAPSVSQEPHRSEAPTVKLSEADLKPYKNAQSIVDWPIYKVESIRGLHKLKPAKSQERLSEILNRTGQSVEEYFRTFPNTTSVEKIRQDHFAGSGFLGHLRHKFHYLMLAHPEGGGVSLTEYRTNDQGKEVDMNSKQPFFTTEGFASIPIHFHPSYQPGERFRYLGRARIQKHDDEVVAFAQRPDNAKTLSDFSVPGKSAELLVQGVAWIDPETFQILEMYTFLLAPRPDIRLTRADTDVVFEEVHFPDSPEAAWLPKMVTVYIGWRDHSFLNVHEYSDFKLFRSKAVIR